MNSGSAADPEFDKADKERLRRLEELMLDRGYVRHPEYGFWVAPGSEEWRAIKRRGEDEQ